MKKKVVSLISGVLISTMCISPIAQASAGIKEVSVSNYIGANKDIFTKISHPEKGVSNENQNITDGVLDYLGDGKLGIVEGKDAPGDRGQGYCWAALGYGDWVYVSTLFSPMMQTISLMDSVLGHDMDPEAVKDLLNRMYDNEFFVEEKDGKDPGSALSKINVKTGEVVNIMSKTKNGIDAQFRNAVELNDKLYMCGAINGMPSIYEIDPNNNDEFRCVYQDETMNSPSAWEDALKSQVMPSIRGIAKYKDTLMISCVNLEGNPYIAATNDIEKGFTKIATSWADDEHKVQGELFGYPACKVTDSIYGGSIWEMIEFNDKLYVAMCTGKPETSKDNGLTFQSFAIVEGTCNGDPTMKESWSWTPVIGDKKDGAKYTFGIDPERTRSGACNMVVYDDHLYIGEYNDTEIALINIMFDGDARFMAENLKQSVNLYRMDKNNDIELVVGDKTEMFPEGGISKFGSGFDRHENQYIWRMQEYNDKLYVGTFDESSLLRPLAQISNGEVLHFTPEEWKAFIKMLSDVLQSSITPDKTPEEKPEVKPEEKPEVKPEEKPEVKPEEKPEVKPEEKPEVKPEEKPEVKPEDRFVEVEYKDMSGNIISTEKVKVAYGKLSMVVKAPEGYTLTDTNNVISIDDNTKSVEVQVMQENAEPYMLINKSEAKKFSKALNELNKADKAFFKGKVKDIKTLGDFQKSFLNLGKDLERNTNSSEDKKLEDKIKFAEDYNKLYEFYTNESTQNKLPEFIKNFYDQILNKENWEKINALVSCIHSLHGCEAGFDFLTSKDGVNFEVISRNGMGDGHNQGLRTFAINNDEAYPWLCIGTANPFFGGQVWLLDEEPTERPDTPVEKPEFRWVRVNYKDTAGRIVASERIKVEYGKLSIVVTPPDGYDLFDTNNEISISDKTIALDVSVVKKAEDTPDTNPDEKPDDKPDENPGKPDVEPDETEARDITVQFKDLEENIVATEKIKVEYGRLTMTVMPPKGYNLVDTNNVISIDDETEVVDVYVMKGENVTPDEKPEVKPDDTDPEDKPEVKPDDKPDNSEIAATELILRLDKKISIHNIDKVVSNSNPEVVKAQVVIKDNGFLRIDTLILEALAKGESDVVVTLKDGTDRMYHVVVIDSNEEIPDKDNTDKPDVNPDDTDSEVKPDVNPDDKPDETPEDKPEVKPDETPDAKPNDKPEDSKKPNKDSTDIKDSLVPSKENPSNIKDVPKSTNTPKTGDMTNTRIWFGITAFSGIALLALILNKFKKFD